MQNICYYFEKLRNLYSFFYNIGKWPVTQFVGTSVLLIEKKK